MKSTIGGHLSPLCPQSSTEAGQKIRAAASPCKKHGAYVVGIFTSVKLPDVAASTAAMISPIPALMKLQLFVLSTTSAIFRPVKFCW